MEMKSLKIKILLIFLFIFYAALLSAQDIQTLDHNRAKIQKQGMIVLGTWATINLISSPLFSMRETAVKKHFHQMNGYWNAVNLLIATGGYVMTQEFLHPELSEVLLEQSKMEKILLFNAALDIGYMVGGAYLIERAKNDLKRAEQLKGFGQSIILQGGFLFLFDIIMYRQMHRNHIEILNLTDNTVLSFSGSGITLFF